MRSPSFNLFLTISLHKQIHVDRGFIIAQMFYSCKLDFGQERSAGGRPPTGIRGSRLPLQHALFIKHLNGHKLLLVWLVFIPSIPGIKKAPPVIFSNKGAFFSGLFLEGQFVKRPWIC